MRLTISFLTVLTILLIAVQQPVRAQNAWSSPATGQPSAQSPEFGYYVPMLTTDNGVAAASYSMHLSDADDSELPMVSDVGCSVGCASGACDEKASRGCARNCHCLRCRQDNLLAQSFGSLEYMHWYNKGISLPPLVTSNIGAIPLQADAGVFGLPTTSVLFGNDQIDDNRQSAGRLMFGRWMDDSCNLALGAKLYAVEGGAVNFTTTSTGNPVIGRPFFNTDPTVNREDALLVAYPGLTTGTVSVTAENDIIGAEIFGRSLLDVGNNYRLDLVGGYQFTRIDSDLAMSSLHSTGVATFAFNDLFNVENQFHAGSVGFYGETYRECWTFSALGKIAVGNMRQTVNIEGNNTVTAGGAVTTNGGLYAQPTNIGAYERDLLVWAPEANLKMSCAVTKQLSVSVGYTFLYFTRVAFAGDQIDRNVNATQLSGGAVVGPAQPAFNFRDTDFWIQTIDLGLSWNY